MAGCVRRCSPIRWEEAARSNVDVNIVRVDGRRGGPHVGGRTGCARHSSQDHLGRHRRRSCPARGGVRLPGAAARPRPQARARRRRTRSPSTTTCSRSAASTTSAAQGAGFGAGRTGHSHQGQDVFADCGTPMVAARAGKVVHKGYHSARRLLPGDCRQRHEPGVSICAPSRAGGGRHRRARLHRSADRRSRRNRQCPRLPSPLRDLVFSRLVQGRSAVRPAFRATALGSRELARATVGSEPDPFQSNPQTNRAGSQPARFGFICLSVRFRAGGPGRP